MMQVQRVEVRRLVHLLLTISVIAAASLIFVGGIAAHGTQQSPVSRVYNCYLEGPESSDSAACQAAVAYGGTQALYDWNGIRQGSAGGNHQALIPDGTLCSGNGAE